MGNTHRVRRRRTGKITYTRASAVTVTNAEGSVSVVPAYSGKEYRSIVKERIPFTLKQRQSIFRRDKYTCRYCGNTTGPFEVDHAIPVADGGSSARSNLVTACEDCNRRKGKNFWKPNPIPA